MTQPEAMPNTTSSTVRKKAVQMASLVRMGHRSRYLSDSIADTAHSLNELRRLAVVYFASKPLDINVNQIGLRIKMIFPNVLAELGPGKNAAGTLLVSSIRRLPLRTARVASSRARSSTRYRMSVSPNCGALKSEGEPPILQSRKV
jgi:hypothetical protein